MSPVPTVFVMGLHAPLRLLPLLRDRGPIILIRPDRKIGATGGHLLEKVVEKLDGLEGAVLCGHSYGAIIAHYAATLRPKKIKALVHISPPPIGSERFRFLMRPSLLLFLLRRLWPIFVTGGLSPIRRSELRRICGIPKEAATGMSEDAIELFMPRESGFFLRDAIVRWPDCEPIQVPTKIFHGDKDTLVLQRMAHQTAEILGCDIQIVPGLGHFLPPENDRALYDRIGAWVRTVNP